MADDKRNTMNGKPVLQVPAKSIINFTSGFAKKLLCDGLTFSTGDACTYAA